MNCSRLKCLSVWLLGCVAVAELVGCGPVGGGSLGGGTPSKATNWQVGALGIQECPHTWPFSKDDSLHAKANHLAKLTAGHSSIPEYNDCQRFIVEGKSGFEYDSIFAIFETLATFHLRLRNTEGDEHFGASAAVIYAENRYSELAIEPGFNCLVMQQAGASEEWHAYMLPVDDVKSCDGSIDVTTATRLNTIPTHRLGTAIQDSLYYPSVARWAFHVVGNEPKQFIVIRCGIGTCFVGGPGVAVPATPQIPPSLPSTDKKQARVYAVAGWYDAQPLAVQTGSGTPPLEPSAVWGTAIPDYKLGEKNSLPDFADWVPVAVIQLDTPSEEYESKLNFTPTTPESMNIVEACASDASSSCPDLPRTLDCEVDSSTGATWYTRHTSAVSGETKYYCAERTDTPDAVNGVVPTTRWRWLPDDETLWFRCMEGCCKVAS